MKFFFVYIILLLTAFQLSSGVPVSAQADIGTPLSELDRLMAAEPRPVLLMLSTDWCRYCRLQKRQLAKNKYFRSRSGSFYFSEFDAESVERVVFGGKVFDNKRGKKTTGYWHDFAQFLLKDNEPAYPVWILLDKDYKELFRYNGYLKPDQVNVVIESLEQLEK